MSVAVNFDIFSARFRFCKDVDKVANSEFVYSVSGADNHDITNLFHILSQVLITLTSLMSGYQNEVLKQIQQFSKFKELWKEVQFCFAMWNF